MGKPKQSPKKESPGALEMKVHVANVSVLQYDPISSLSLDKERKKLALFRSGDNPVIEIWDLTHQPFLQFSLTDLESVNGKVSVEGLTWARGRLFSCGLHGFVIEHDLANRNMKKKYTATSGPVWSLESSPDENAIGAVTEDGFINIFDLLDDELQFRKVLDRQEGRILCLSWSPESTHIVTGSVDNIRLWEVERGHAIQRLSVGRSKKNETIVWCVKIIEDLTLISGDSRGVVSFWDGKIGVLKFKVVTHRADILCMAVSADRNFVYVAGVEPNIVLLQRANKTWVKSHERRIHTNDVTCLDTLGMKLISGGLDCDLTISTPPTKKMKRQLVSKYPPLRQPPTMFTSLESKRILVQEPRGMTLWRLPEEGQELTNLLDFRSSSNQLVFSSCLSPDGNFLVYSTWNKVHLFRLATINDGSVIPARLKKGTMTLEVGEETEWEPQNWYTAFLGNSRVLSVTADGSTVQVMELENESYTVVYEARMETLIDKSGVLGLTATGPSASLLTYAQEVYILTFKEDYHLDEVVNVPKYTSPVTSMRLHENLPLLLCTYADHSYRLYDRLSKRILYQRKIGETANTEKRKKPEVKANAFSQVHLPCQQPLLGAAWTSDGATIVFRELSKLHLVQLNPSVIGTSESQLAPGKRRKLEGTPVKNAKTESNDSDDVVISEKSVDCQNYKYVSHVEFFGTNSDLLVFELKPSTLISKLPPAFARKRFGM